MSPVLIVLLICVAIAAAVAEKIERIEDYKFNYNASLARKISSCNDLTFLDVILVDSVSGVRRSAKYSKDFVQLSWYGAICCCRTLGMHLTSPTTAAEFRAIHTSVRGDAFIGWSDVYADPSGLWRSLLKGPVDDSVFFTSPLPKATPGQCMEIGGGNGNTFYLANSETCSIPYNERILCEGNTISLEGDCFAPISSCSEQEVIDYVTTKKCPANSLPEYPTTTPTTQSKGCSSGCCQNCNRPFWSYWFGQY